MPLFVVRDEGRLPETDARVVRGMPGRGLAGLLERLRNRRTRDSRISLRKVRGERHRHEIRLNAPAVWGGRLPAPAMMEAYARVLSAAEEAGWTSVVVPLLTSAPGFMVDDEMLHLAMEAIREYLNRRAENDAEDMWVWLLLPEGVPTGADRWFLANAQSAYAEQAGRSRPEDDDTLPIGWTRESDAPADGTVAEHHRDPQEERRFWNELHQQLAERAEQPPASPLPGAGTRLRADLDALNVETRRSQQLLDELKDERRRLTELLLNRRDTLPDLQEDSASTLNLLANLDEVLMRRQDYTDHLKQAADMLQAIELPDGEQQDGEGFPDPGRQPGDGGLETAPGASEAFPDAEIRFGSKAAQHQNSRMMYCRVNRPAAPRKTGDSRSDAESGRPQLSAQESVFGSTGGWTFPTDMEAKSSQKPLVLDVYKELNQLMEAMEESFYEMLFRLIREKKMDETECYNRANLDRRAFSKIRKNKQCKPKKTTVVALCIALKLDWNTACQMLAKAGYSMTKTNRFDMIVEYCIVRKIYDVYYVNLLLDEYGQPLLGSEVNESDASGKSA